MIDEIIDWIQRPDSDVKAVARTALVCGVVAALTFGMFLVAVAFLTGVLLHIPKMVYVTAALVVGYYVVPKLFRWLFEDE